MAELHKMATDILFDIADLKYVIGMWESKIVYEISAFLHSFR